MLFFSVPVFSAGVMTENNSEVNSDSVRLRRVFQTASVRRERATTRTVRLRVDDNLFDGLQPSSLQC